MNLAQRSAAARNAGAALAIASLFAAGMARAEGEVQLLLPLVRAMAFGVAAAQASGVAERSVTNPFGVAPPPQRASGAALPSRLRIPDGYSTEYDLDPPRWARPVERDRLVSWDLISKPRHGWTASIAYDEETHRPFHGSGEVLRIFAEFGF